MLGRRTSAEWHVREGLPLVHLVVAVDHDELRAGDACLRRSYVEAGEDLRYRLNGTACGAVGHGYVRGKAVSLLRNLS